MFDYNYEKVMKKLSNQNISVLFLTFVGSATLLFLTVEAQNETGNATTADNATSAENATAEGSISGRSSGDVIIKGKNIAQN